MIRIIWNPWHGCVKKSEGCKYCYMYYNDSQRNMDGSKIFKVKNEFNYPLQKDKNGQFKVKSGQNIHVCLTSDFFLEEADKWRNEAWQIMRQRPDVIFTLLTKRPERIKENLPDDWNDGWENIHLNVTCENQIRADERLPILIDLPFKHKGIMCAPFIDEINLDNYLDKFTCEEILCDGENYDGNRKLNYEWVENLYNQAKKRNITFRFISTGNYFIKDNKEYHIPNKQIQYIQAQKSGLQYEGKKYHYILRDPLGIELTEDELYKPYYHPIHCKNCSQRDLCGGCTRCGKCEK